MSAKELVTEHLRRRHPAIRFAPGETKSGLSVMHARAHDEGRSDHEHPTDGSPAFRLADENLIEEGAA